MNSENNNLPKLSAAADKLKGSPMFQFLARAQELEKQGRKIYHYEIGDSSFDTPENIKQAAIDSIKGGDTHYVNSSGISDLREAVRQEIKKTRGFLPEPSQIVIAPAISFIYFLTRTVADPGDEVIVPDPGFSSYYSAFDFIGVKWVGVPLREENEFRMSPDDIRKAITPKTKLIIINSPQNPTGAVMKKEEIMEVAKIAAEKNIYLLSDEAYDKMTYDYPHYSPGIFDECKKHIILMSSFSKSYAMPGFRLGWACAPQHLADKLGLMVQTIISSVPAFVQKAGIEALTGNQSFLAESMKEYRKRRDEAVRLFNSMPGVTCLKPEGAFYVFPNIKGTGMTGHEFCEFALEKAGVVLLPGELFGKHGEGYIRMVYAGSMENIREGLGKLKQALEERN